MSYKMHHKGSVLVVHMMLMLALSACGKGDNSIKGAIEVSGELPVTQEAENALQMKEEKAGATFAEETTGDENVKTQNGDKLIITVNGYSFTATLEENDAVSELIEMLEENPITLALIDYSGFEKVGSLGRSLTTCNKQTTTQAGDIVLYGGNQIVIFYGSNSWSYTRLAKVDDLTDWKKALGNGDVSVILSID